MTDEIARLKSALADRYAIEYEIGSGGMATVYLAEDLKHKRKVAVKVLRSELAAALGAERFLREIEVTAKLSHPHILPLLDSGTAEEQPTAVPPYRRTVFLYYVMPYIEGESLRDRITREGQLPLEDALQIARQVAAALSYAHSQGVIHRDIKPENILFSAGEAVVADFGIARAVTEAGAERLTGTGLTVGTPAYMSPEQASGEQKLDGRSDIYALGCVLYEMLAGDAPFTASTPQALIAKKLAEPTPRITVVREAVPSAIEAALIKALVKNPADRFVTAQQFADALEASGDREAPAKTTVVTTERGGKRRKWLWVVGVTAAAAVTVGVVGQLRRANSVYAGNAVERLVVAPFENRTGDSAAADWAFMAAEFLTRSIDRAGVVTVVPASGVRDLVREVDAADAMPVEEIAHRLGARYVVTGSYSTAAGQLRFVVEVTDAESGELLRSLDPISGPADSLDVALTLVAERVTAATVALFGTELDPAIARTWSAPPSVEAVRGLLATQDLFCRARWGEVIEQARPYLLEIPDFAPLLMQVSISYFNLGRNREADSVLALIEPLREQTTNLEQHLMDMIHGMLHGDNAEVTRSVEQAYRILPGGFGYHAGWNAARLNRFDDALVRLQANDMSSPCYRTFFPWWKTMAEVYYMLGRYEDALDIARDGLRRFPNVRPYLRLEAAALARLDRTEAVDSLLDVIAGLPVQSIFGYTYSPGSQTAYIGVELKAMGLREAYESAMERSLAWFANRPDDELRAYHGEALYYAESWSDADTIFAALIAYTDERDQFVSSRAEPADVAFRGFRAVALAHLGRREEALEIDRWLEQLDRPYLRGANTRWRAAIAAALGDRAGAVQFLHQAMEEGMELGYNHFHEPEWETLRDYEPYQLLMRPERPGR